eukprot:6014695-Amphidinium_carterae.1
MAGTALKSIESSLRVLQSKFGAVFFVPGSHCMSITSVQHETRHVQAEHSDQTNRVHLVKEGTKLDASASTGSSCRVS